MQEIVQAYSTVNPAVILSFQVFVADLFAYAGTSPYHPVNQTVPVVYAGGAFGGYYASFTEFISDVPFQILGPNQTIRFDRHTYPNQVLLRTHIVGWFQIHWFVIALSLIVMMLAVFKLASFITATGIQLSIAQGVIFLCFLSSFFMFVFSGLCGSFRVYNMYIVPTDVIQGFEFFFLGFTFTAVLILGFYFGEIASLTSAQTVPGLDKLKIPAIIVIVVLWGVVLGISIASGTDTGFTSGTQATSLNDFYFAMLCCVIPGLSSLVLIWGCVSLLRALAGSGNTTAVIRVVILSLFIVVVYWLMAFLGLLISFMPTGWDFTTLLGDMPLDWEQGVRAILIFLGFNLMNASMIMSFSVSVQKEIEISKSGTSSTSGSSSTSSSSSSSSSNDPVIEL